MPLVKDEEMLSDNSFRSQTENPPINPKSNPNFPRLDKAKLKNDHQQGICGQPDNNYLSNENEGRVLSKGITAHGVDPRPEHYIELHTGGSLARIKTTEVNPLKNKYYVSQEVSGHRQAIKTFTQKSRKNFLQKLSSINRDKIPPNKVLFLTLTIDGYRPPHTCKKYLNNFLTQLRQRLDGLKWFYAWKAEFHTKARGGNGQLHFHICLFGLSQLSHKWIRHTWSRITLGYEEYKARCESSNDQKEVFKKLVVTDIEMARNWSATQKYMNAVLCYVSKNQKEEQDLIEQYKDTPVGRFWGIGRLDVYKMFVDKVVVKLSERDFAKVRRVFIRYIRGSWQKRHGDKFDWKKWKQHKKYLLSGYTTIKRWTHTIQIVNDTREIWTFIDNESLERILKCLFPDNDILQGTRVDKPKSIREYKDERRNYQRSLDLQEAYMAGKLLADAWNAVEKVG